MDGLKKECKLCDKVISDAFKAIDDVTKSIFDVLFLKLTLDTDIQNVICSMCSSKLFAALDFKSTCLSTDYTIIPYVDFDNPKPVDLKEVYVKENVRKQSGRKFDNHQVICRLCLHPIFSDLKSIQEVPPETMEIYIPEINFAMTTNPVTCIKCHEALRVHSHFIKYCLEVEKKRSTAAMDVGDTLLTDPRIKTEEIEIKDEQIEGVTDSEIPCKDEKQENEEGDTSAPSGNGVEYTIENKSLYDPGDLKPTTAGSTSANCESVECMYKTTSESCVADRKSRHKHDSGMQVNKSEGSNKKMKRQPISKNQVKSMTRQEHQGDRRVYNTRHRSALSRHQLSQKDLSQVQTKHKDSLKGHCLIHKHPSGIQTYGCSRCDFKTKIKKCLKKHQLVHKDPSEIRMYECAKCKFITKYKGNLTAHNMLTHRDPSEIQMYECTQCSYKSKKKSHIKSHELMHRDPSEVEMYECSQCSYKTKVRINLKLHQLIHKHPTEVEMYECSQCDFKTKRIPTLKRHQLRHRDPSEIRMYECSQCSYKAKTKDNLNRHQLTHKDPSETEMYECASCKFVTKRKNCLIAHLLTHRDPSEIQMHECGRCSYKTRTKGSLKLHQLTHKHPSEIQMHKCANCEFITKHKGNLARHMLTHNDPS